MAYCLDQHFHVAGSIASIKQHWKHGPCHGQATMLQTARRQVLQAHVESHPSCHVTSLLQWYQLTVAPAVARLQWQQL